MKRILSRIILLMPGFVLVLACTGFQHNRLGTLALRVRLDNGLELARSTAPAGSRSAKSITPVESWNPTLCRLSGTGPGGATFSREMDRGTGIEEKLVPGEWTIAVRAMTSGGKEVASGTSTCFLQPGRATDVTIVLYPLEGSGGLSVTITTNLALPPGGRLSGNLVHRGLPGHPAPATPTVLPIEAPITQTSLSFEDIPAGHYALTLKLIDSDGIVSGGCADTVLVLAGFLSEGTCRIDIGEPLGGFYTEIYPAFPLDPPILSVQHVVSSAHPLTPLAIPRYGPEAGEEMKRTWYFNGMEVGEALRLVGDRGLLPEGALVIPPDSFYVQVSRMRFDMVEESVSSLRAGSASVILDSVCGNDFEHCGWRGSYDYASALSAALHEDSTPFGKGSGAKFAAKAVATAPNGLIIVSGLDEEGALHAFAAGYGAGLDPPPPSGASVLPIDASWVRLWRDRIRIGSTYRNADRLAVSDDGRYFAAASSASDWLFVGSLDDQGRPLDAYSLTSSAGEALADMRNLRALRFSPEGNRLYAAANTAGAVFAFDISQQGISLASRLTLSRPEGASGLSLQDLEVTKSGALIVTAADVSRLYFLTDEGGLSETGFIQGASGGADPWKPGALAISPEGDAFHVLCDGARILCYERRDGISPYSQASSFTLTEPTEGAFLMDTGYPLSGGAEMIFVAGGEEAGFLETGAGRSIVTSRSICAESDSPTGLSTATGLCFTRGAFILSGGSSGIVSVFGAD